VGEVLSRKHRNRTSLGEGAVTHEFARKLRREQTEVERKLWHALRDRRFDGIKFRRQQPIGSYVADFVCFEAKLVIELDGSKHAFQKKLKSGRKTAKPDLELIPKRLSDLIAERRTGR